MIVCSCNLLSIEKIKNYIQTQKTHKAIPSVGTVMKGIGCERICGTCAPLVRDEIKKHYERKE